MAQGVEGRGPGQTTIAGLAAERQDGKAACNPRSQHARPSASLGYGGLARGVWV